MTFFSSLLRISLCGQCQRDLHLHQLQVPPLAGGIQTAGHLKSPIRMTLVQLPVLFLSGYIPCGKIKHRQSELFMRSNVNHLRNHSRQAIQSQEIIFIFRPDNLFAVIRHLRQQTADSVTLPLPRELAMKKPP